MKAHLYAVLLFAWLTIPTIAQQVSTDYQKFVAKADSLLKAKEYKKAAGFYTEAFKANGWKGTLNDRFKAARAWAKSDVPDSAFSQLFRFVNKGYFVGYDRVVNEPDFSILQKDKRWSELLNEIRKNEAFNMDFERVHDADKLPDGWFVWGTRNYVLKTDSVTKHRGKYAVRIEPMEDIEKKSFGCVAYKISNKYQGKEIEVKAYIKMENVDDAIGLLIRLDSDDPLRSVGFDNMMQKEIRGTKDWTQYSVKIPFSKETKEIFIGVINSGSGLLWCDDFELFIDGKPITK